MADRVARCPVQLCSRDWSPCYYVRVESDFLGFYLFSIPFSSSFFFRCISRLGVGSSGFRMKSYIERCIITRPCADYIWSTSSPQLEKCWVPEYSALEIRNGRRRTVWYGHLGGRVIEMRQTDLRGCHTSLRTGCIAIVPKEEMLRCAT